MRVISKYKDYYDFLSGIYGVDPLIVLDSREFTMPDITAITVSDYSLYRQECTLILYIGDYCVDSYCLDGVCYYGEDLKQFESEKKHSKYYYRYIYNKSENDNNVNIRLKNQNKYVNITNNIYKDSTNLNEKYNCPILVRKDGESDKLLYKNCILKDLNLNSFISPEDIYKMISSWISLQKTKSENVVDNMTNKQKIESKGFDNKTSFRPNIK